MIPRGKEEVSCSVENGLMLHDWEKVQESPVFKRGFKPMDGHDNAKKETVDQAVDMAKNDEENKVAQDGVYSDEKAVPNVIRKENINGMENGITNGVPVS